MLGWLLVGAVTACGAAVQASLGFGFALVLVPVLATAEPRAVPATVLLLSLPLNLIVLARERHAVDVAGLPWLVAGLVPGAAAGALLARSMSLDALAGAAGATVIALAAVSALRAPRPLGNPARFAAAAASGVVNTVASTGGPLIALVYRRRRGPQLRATIAALFVVSNVLSLVAVGAAGKLEAAHARWAFVLLGPVLAGTGAGMRLAQRLDRRWLRPAVLVFAAISGAAAVVRALL